MNPDVWEFNCACGQPLNFYLKHSERRSENRLEVFHQKVFLFDQYFSDDTIPVPKYASHIVNRISVSLADRTDLSFKSCQLYWQRIATAFSTAVWE